jgi:hypothetical protein
MGGQEWKAGLTAENAKSAEKKVAWGCRVFDHDVSTALCGLCDLCGESHEMRGMLASHPVAKTLRRGAAGVRACLSQWVDSHPDNDTTS